MRGFGTPAAVRSVTMASTDPPSVTVWASSAHVATIGGFAIDTRTVAALAGASAGA